MPLIKKPSKDGKTVTVCFCLPEESAEGARRLFLAGEFNDWKPAPMRKAKGLFSLNVKLPAGASYQYRFVTPDDVWLNDPEADCYVFSPFARADNSVVML